MGLYDEDGNGKIYISGKNHINIEYKKTEMIKDYDYAIDKDNIPSIFLNNIKFNELFLKLKNSNYKTYWLGYIILAFDNNDFYYGFTVKEIKDKIKNRLNIYFIDENENLKNKLELNLIEL